MCIGSSLADHFAPLLLYVGPQGLAIAAPVVALYVCLVHPVGRWLSCLARCVMLLAVVLGCVFQV